jgi:hypothetical protein
MERHEGDYMTSSSHTTTSKQLTMSASAWNHFTTNSGQNMVKAGGRGIRNQEEHQ